MSPCPHCGAKARIEASAFFKWRCGVCGGPVVPAGSGSELASLVRAHRARAMAFGWFAAAVFFGCIAALAGGVALLLWSATHLAALVLGALAATAAIVAGTGRVRGARHNAAARRDLEAAWQSASAGTDPS